MMDSRTLRSTLATAATLALASTPACKTDDEPSVFGTNSASASAGTDSSSTGVTSITASGTSGTTTDSGGTTDSSTSGGTGPKFDTPDGQTGASDGMEGCAKADFLFIIDNSISMGDEQQNLTNSFPDFIQTIQSDVVSDYHVMVIDTDAEDKWDEKLAECHGPDCANEDPNDNCGVIAPQDMWTCGNLPPIDACDGMLGAGVDHDGSVDRSSCNVAGDKRWFDDQQPNQDQTFQCIANLYSGNSPELTMGGMLAALQPGMVGAGGCNEGFLRDDAVLVVTFISDEEDMGDSPGTPQSWYDDLLALKNGNQTAVVVLGLLGDTGLPGAVCPPDSVPGSNGGEYSPQLIDFVEKWGGRGLWGSVCEPSYASFFDEAVALVKTACDEFVPEG